MSKAIVEFMKDEGNTKNKVFNPCMDGPLLAPFIEEAVIAKEKISLYQGSLKDIKDRAKDELGIKPKLFNKILAIHFKRNRDEVEEENEELMEIYDNAFVKKQDTY